MGNMKYSWRTLFACVLVINCMIVGRSSGEELSFRVINETEVTQYLEDLEPRYSDECNKQISARWDYVTNVNDETEQKSIEATNAFGKYQATVQLEILEKFNISEWDSLSPIVKRELKYLSIQGPAGMPDEDVQKMNELLSKMETAFADATVCEYQNPTKCDLTLEPDIEEKLKSTTDYDELAHYWTAWHDAMSAGVSPSDYTQFIQYQNEMAKANGYNDMSELWLQPYDNGVDGWTVADFKNEMHGIWNDLRPYYQKIHAYVRMELRKNSAYTSKIKRFGHLPAHLMGNMWSQQWGHLENTTKPFPNTPSVDATEAMLKAGYNVSHMFQVSDQFFEDMGLLKMTDEFWAKTMFEKPTDGTKVICHASAEDMCLGKDNKDFRVKMCTNVDMDDLITVHHELGHIEYFMQYTNLHYIFRNGANPGFHEAIGDALALAVTTPKHLQCYLKLDLGLVIDCDTGKSKNQAAQEEIDINFLYRMALDKFAFFPFAISMDSWRWEVQEGKLPEAEYNSRWWEIRQENQGIIPPSPRDANRFDPAAKYHIVGNVEYIRYFVSYILQFQFYEEMCIAAGQYNPESPDPPLHQCDFSGNKAAGEKLGEMMKLGFSKPWPEALNILTNGKGLSASSLLNYFKPLFGVLDERLVAGNESPCYGKDCEVFAKTYIEGDYEMQASNMCNNVSLASWAYQTDLTNPEAETAYLAASLAQSEFRNKQWKEVFSQYDLDAFNETGSTKRQLKFLNSVGTAALPQDKLEEYNKLASKLSRTYGTAKVCPYRKQTCDLQTEGLSLEPDLESILATSTNYNELAYYWRAWRDNTGKLMRADYNQYVDLNNEAAILNGFKDTSESWVLRYESETFKEDMEKLWGEVKGIYEDLHAFVRHKLASVYPQMAGDKPLPAHVLGNMWAQTWGNVYQYVLPYPNAPVFDVTEKLRKAYSNNDTAASQMFDVANGFFLSLGLRDMKMAFGPKAMIKRPVGREVQCHASAWDFCDGADFRVKMCTNTDMEDFITVHHELGHIQYYLQYKHLNITLRGGANPGFHEAIGDVVALSVATPAHMKILGLLDSTQASPESTINYLMKIALEKIAFLPFGFLIDSYRWRIFDGQIPRENLTYNWLKMTMEFQGVHPPYKRSDLDLDFDAGAKYHVASGSSYIQYFVSTILQFQLHRELCKEAGIYPSKPLHECDIYMKKNAGAKFANILQAGASKKWQELLTEITGQPNLDVSALLEYFEPLTTFLKTQEAELKYERGWDANSFEDYFGEEPASTGPSTIATDPTGASTGPSTIATDPTGASTGPSTIATDPTGASTSSDSDKESTKAATSGTRAPENNDDEIETAAIIVGIILGAAVVVILIGYFILLKIRKR